MGLAPENPNQSGSGHNVVNTRRITSDNDVSSGGSGFAGNHDDNHDDDNHQECMDMCMDYGYDELMCEDLCSGTYY